MKQTHLVISGETELTTPERLFAEVLSLVMSPLGMDIRIAILIELLSRDIGPESNDEDKR